MARPARTVKQKQRDLAAKRILPEGDTPAISAATATRMWEADEPALAVVEEKVWHGEEASTMYRWEVPGADGYVLPIDVVNAAGVTDARSAALATTISMGTGEPRALTPLEGNWIRTTDPAVVKDTQMVTLDHQSALAENERLGAQNAAYRACREMFARCGIDIHNPGVWVAAQRADAEGVVRDAAAERDAVHRVLANTLADMQRKLGEVIDATGFAPPRAVAAADPDYSRLTILAADGVNPAAYERLAGANWMSHSPDEPLTEAERKGRDMVAGEHGIIRNYWRKSASPFEQAALDAFERRLRVEFGE